MPTMLEVCHKTADSCADEVFRRRCRHLTNANVTADILNASSHIVGRPVSLSAPAVGDRSIAVSVVCMSVRMDNLVAVGGLDA